GATGERGLFGGFTVLEQLEVRGVSGAVACLRIDLVYGVIDGHGGFTKAGGDELELALVVDDVAGCVDARQVRLESLIDADAIALEIEAPVCDGAEVGLEADEREHGVDVERLFLLRLVVEDGDACDTRVAVDAAHFAEREQLDLAFGDGLLHQLHRVRVCAEPVASMDDDETRRGVLEIEHPVDCGIAAADNEYALAGVACGIPDVVLDALAEQLVVAGALEYARRERALAACNEHGLRGVARAIGRDDPALAVTDQILYLLLESHVRAELCALLDEVGGEVAGEDARESADVVDVFFRIQ